MHLLAAQAGTVPDGEAVDLGQTPADMVFLSAADSELAGVAAAYDAVSAEAGGNDAPALRLASLLQLGHNLSVDLYVDKVIRPAKLVVVRMMGGVRYWPYGLEQAAQACRDAGSLLAVVPGDDRPDPALQEYCTAPPSVAHRLWRYCAEGGAGNFAQMLRYAAALLGRDDVVWREPAPMPPAALY
ncbi:MAG TPA: cobaltochelatase subunit CobN, partial [Azospirillaceae bacterium]|nr:cobaltochelatase subunit CobN [Azospirillaceae bacterium]